LGQPERLAGWLWGVAWRIALHAKARAARPGEREAQAFVDRGGDPVAEAGGRDLCAAVAAGGGGPPGRDPEARGPALWGGQNLRGDRPAGGLPPRLHVLAAGAGTRTGPPQIEGARHREHLSPPTRSPPNDTIRLIRPPRHGTLPRRGDAPSSVRREEAAQASASRVAPPQAHVFLSSTRRFRCLFSVSWRSGLVGAAGARWRLCGSRFAPGWIWRRSRSVPCCPPAPCSITGCSASRRRRPPLTSASSPTPTAPLASAS